MSYTVTPYIPIKWTLIKTNTLAKTNSLATG